MYLLDRKKFGSVSADIYVQDGMLSVYGKISDRVNHTSRPLPSLHNFCRLPSFLLNEVEKRMQYGDVPSDRMSSELRKFCNKVWLKASEHNALYGRK